MAFYLIPLYLKIETIHINLRYCSSGLNYFQATQSVQEIPGKSEKSDAITIDILENNIPEKSDEDETANPSTLNYDIEASLNE